jgi:hypothetical protein
MVQANPGGGKNRIADGGCDDGRTGLAETAPQNRAPELR